MNFQKLVQDTHKAPPTQASHNICELPQLSIPTESKCNLSHLDWYLVIGYLVLALISQVDLFMSQVFYYNLTIQRNSLFPFGRRDL